jgi:hypothetical protein
VARRLALLFLGIASPVLLILFTVPVPGAETAFTVLVMGYPVALIVLAVARYGGLGALRLPLLALLVLLITCGVTLLILRGHAATAPWIGGLPLAAAVQLYGLWLAPLAVVVLAHALTFDRYGLSENDLDRLHEISDLPGPDA